MSEFPERVLWQGVVMQAVLDAISPPRANKSERIERLKTIAWFNINNPDFILICDLAGYSPDWLIRHMRKKQSVVFKRINRKMPRRVLKQVRA